MSTPPVFTRYLYELRQVEYSLQISLLAKCREEALFWAYELYHSGFQTEVWYWVRDLYVEHYEEYNPVFKTHLDNLYLQWKATGDACLLGTIVGTLAMRDPNGKGHGERFVILYKEDRHQMQEVKGNPRNYLKQVSLYPIRPEAKYLAKQICNVLPEMVREAYLGVNWLYYCAETPIWATRIREGRGVVDDLGKRVVFGLDSEATRKEYRIENGSDEDLEAFYERWGLEPDEQCAEMHRWHGIDFQ